MQQKSNGAFFKNSRARCASSTARRARPRNTPGLSEKDRYASASGPGEAGDPDSKAKNFVSVQLP